MSLKVVFFFFFGVACFLLVPVVSGQEKPRSYSLERYAVIWQSSFFGHGTVGKAVPLTSEYFSLAGVFKFEGGHGAVIVNRINGKVEQIETGSLSPGGFELLEVVGLPGGESTRVRVKKEGAVFWVANEKELKSQTEWAAESTRPPRSGD